MRDGNWSPDFSISAEQVEYFYHLQGGHEDLMESLVLTLLFYLNY